LGYQRLCFVSHTFADLSDTGIRWGIGKLKIPQGLQQRGISSPTGNLDIWRIRQTVIRNVTMLRSSKFSTKDFGGDLA